MASKPGSKAQQEKALALRRQGAGYPAIADQQSVTEAAAVAAIDAVLARRLQVLEAQAGLMPALEMERLDALELRTQDVLDQAIGDGEPLTVLRAVDRLVRISGRRSEVMPTGRLAGGIEGATRTELQALPEDLRGSAAAMTALLLARSLDAGLPPREVAAVARELRATMTGLASRMPEGAEDSKVDELRLRRAKRLAGHG